MKEKTELQKLTSSIEKDKRHLKRIEAALIVLAVLWVVAQVARIVIVFNR